MANIRVFQNVYSNGQIEEITNIIRKRFELETPVDVKDFIKDKLLGEIIENESLKYEGVIKKSGNSFIIEYRPNTVKRRDNFTLAHELGHLFLHLHYMTNDWGKIDLDEYNEVIFTRYGSGSIEREANSFAGSFLMPEEEFTLAFYKYYDSNLPDEVDLEALADKFKVSKLAAHVRAKRLGLIT